MNPLTGMSTVGTELTWLYPVNTTRLRAGIAGSL
jgi:hypothetical protein